MVFTVMTLCSLVVGYQTLGGTYCLYLQGRSEQSWNSGWLCRSREKGNESQMIGGFSLPFDQGIGVT
jgi:hypothetical protein